MTDTGRTIFGGGASLGLPEPDFSSGWGPGFALEAHGLTASECLWDYAYQLDDATQNGTANAVDDDWFTWDPAGPAPERFIIKRTGFYWVHARIALGSGTPAAAWAMYVQVGNASAYQFIPGGATNAARYSGIVPFDGGDQCFLQLQAFTNVGLTVQGATIVFVPLFA